MLTASHILLNKLFRLFWLYCTWAYVGAFRSADLLAEETQAYRPGSTLCFEHVTWHCEQVEGKSVRYLLVKVWPHTFLNLLTCRIEVPEPKEMAEEGSSVQVELLPTGTYYDPTVSFLKYMKQIGKVRLDGPVFSNGSKLLTSARVNKTLRKLLSRYVNYDKMQVLGHSFR